MRFQRLTAALVAIVIALSLGACSFFGTKPESQEQQLAITTAMATAQAGCTQLGKSLKPDEVSKLKASLTAVAALAAKDTDPAAVLAGLAQIDPRVAPYAPAILGGVQLALLRVDVDSAKGTTLAVMLQGVASYCAGSLPGPA